MRFSAVIFDWAGTMVDFGSCAPVEAMGAAFAQESVALAEADIRAGMGLAKRDHVVSILALEHVAAAWRSAHGNAPTDRDIDRIFGRLEPLMRESGGRRAALIPGAADAARTLAARGLRIGSTTGYTRAMMEPILAAAAEQGYAPETVVCAGETPMGRPAPFMLWTALMRLGVFPTSAVCKIDDAPAGIAEGRNAGCFTIGVAASGNTMGLELSAYQSLSPTEREDRLAQSRAQLLAAGADLVIETVAEAPEALAALA